MRKMRVSSNVPQQDRVERLRRGEVVAERLLDDDARARRCSPTLAELLDDRAEQHRRDGEVVRRAAARCRAPCGCAWNVAGSVVVAVDVAQQAGRAWRTRRRRGRRASRGCRGRAPELVEVPAGLGHADDRHVEVAALHHRLQRREDLLVGEVAGRAEEDQRVGVRFAHGRSLIRARYFAGFSTWPPNSKRIAESSLFWKSASPRELKRS